MLTWLTNGTSTDDFDTPCDDENDLRAIQKCKRRNSDELKRLYILEDSSRADLNMNEKQNNHNHDGDQQMESLPIHEREIPGIHRNGNESDLLHDLSSTRDSAILPDHPSTWPQRPLMVRPTVTSQTKIKGIRRANREEYLDPVGFSKSASCIIPINDGREAEGESIVVDFESTYFVGTLLLRIKQAPAASLAEKDKHESRNHESVQRDYFANKKRKFQAVIKGHFKTPLSMSRCVTGQLFERPAGPLPAQWVVKNLIRLFSILAPQLDASLDKNKPRFLSPLVATAQTVLSEEDENDSSDTPEDQKSTRPSSSSKERARYLDIDVGTNLLEPHSLEPTSVLSTLGTDSDLDITIPDTTLLSATKRALARKKIFNSLSAKGSSEPQFDPNRTYTFEFYQHLLDFGDELALDMGAIGGTYPLAQAMDGQPLKIMAAYKSGETGEDIEPLWSFDLFHESLYPYAQTAADRERKS